MCYAVIWLQKCHLFNAYSSAALCCLASSLHGTGKAVQINFHVPSLQNTRFTGGKKNKKNKTSSLLMACKLFLEVWS